MSNFAIVICLLIIATTSEALSLNRLSPTSIAEKSLNDKIKSSRKEVEEAYKQAINVVDPSLSATNTRIHDLVDGNDEEKDRCSQKALKAIKVGRKRTGEVMEWALAYLTDVNSELELCKTAQPNDLFGSAAAAQCINKIKEALPGMVATAKTELAEVLQNIPKNTRQWSKFRRVCEADDSAVMDEKNEPEAPQDSDH